MIDKAYQAIAIMSDDDADLELLELLRQSLGMSRQPQVGISSDTGTYINSNHHRQPDRIAWKREMD